MTFSIRILFVLASVLASGCDPAPCVRLSDCPSSLTCSAGVCIAPPTDGSMEQDAGLDAGRDAGDAGSTDSGARDTPG